MSIQWSGSVEKKDIASLTEMIRVMFEGKAFSTMFHSYINDSPFPQERGAHTDQHRHLDEIKSYEDTFPPFIWIVSRNNWSIHVGETVCLTERCLLVEKVYTNGFMCWCWTLEAEEKEETMDAEEVRIRKTDYDLEAYLENNEDIFTLDDIKNIHAEVPGHNDEDSWYWIIELHDGRFVLTCAWCDCTGWDCQSGGSSQIAESAEATALLAPEEDQYRRPRKNLLAQLHGTQAFGLEIIEN